MAKRWTRRITMVVAIVAMLATSSCMGSGPATVDAFTEGTTGIYRCVTASSTIGSTLTTTGEIAFSAITQARKNAGCATPESGIGPWTYLKAQVFLERHNGAVWTLCASTFIHTTTTAQFVLPSQSYECGTGNYRVVATHWTSVAGYGSYKKTTTPVLYVFI